MEFILWNSIRLTPLFEKVIMSKKSLNQIALESERIEEVEEDRRRTEELQQVEMSEPVTNEPELVDADHAMDEADDEYDVEQSEAFAIESLCAWRDLLAHQLATKTV